MPIPFLIMAIIAGSGALGAGKTVKAGIDNNKASKVNRESESIVEEAIEAAQEARKNCGEAIRCLGEQKVFILENSIKPFISAFEKIHNIEFTESTGLKELQNFKLDKVSFSELKELKNVAGSIVNGVAGGTVMGALTAFGAYNGAMLLGTASTGTAIGTLTGAAATKATLAFLGGGALKVGGLGIAGGTTILGGLVAGPALAVFGFVIGAKASANKERSYENLAKAQELEEEMLTVKILCKGIRMRANLFDRLLIKLNFLFEPLVLQLEELISMSGTDFQKYTVEQKSLIGKIMSVAGAIKAVLDTAILNDDGGLKEESLAIASSVDKALFES